MASAAARTFASLTSQPKQFQLFHPIGGVRAIVSPHTILSGRSVLPRALRTRRVTTWLPFSFRTPVRRPLWGSIWRPAGSLPAVKVIGRSPVAGTVKKKGEPGRTPTTRAPLMRGSGEALGVSTTAGSRTGAIAPPQHPALPKGLAVAGDFEHDAASLTNLIVDADRGHEPFPLAFQRDAKRAGGMRANPVLKPFAVQEERVIIHRPVRVRIAPT